jgi:hypothetical protein
MIAIDFGSNSASICTASYSARSDHTDPHMTPNRAGIAFGSSLFPMSNAIIISRICHSCHELFPGLAGGRVISFSQKGLSRFQ